MSLYYNSCLLDFYMQAVTLTSAITTLSFFNTSYKIRILKPNKLFFKQKANKQLGVFSSVKEQK